MTVKNVKHVKLDILGWQMLVPRTSRRLPTPTPLGRSLKILFDHPGDVPICRPGDVLI